MASTVTFDYAKLHWKWAAHHARFTRLVEARKLVCQECRGSGGETVPILDDGTGPFETCGFCEGTGYVTPWLRGTWLRWKKEGKRISNGGSSNR